MKDELGNRMKSHYENRTCVYLPRRTYSILRLDGKAFHTYTRGCERPFDAGLIHDMNETAIYLCKNIQGAKIGFVQSDEISILMTDFETHQTDAWFDGNIQKIVSVAASLAASKFNQLRLVRKAIALGYNGLQSGMIAYETIQEMKLADFDARTFTIPSKTEVANMFLWRQQDTVRNSISSVAQSLYSSKELHGKNMSEQQDMIHEKGQNWNDYDPMIKRGRFIYKKEINLVTEFKGIEFQQKNYIRNVWVVEECPIFSQNLDFLYDRIPDLP